MNKLAFSGLMDQPVQQRCLLPLGMNSCRFPVCSWMWGSADTMFVQHAQYPVCCLRSCTKQVWRSTPVTPALGRKGEFQGHHQLHCKINLGYKILVHCPNFSWGRGVRRSQCQLIQSAQAMKDTCELTLSTQSSIPPLYTHTLPTSHLPMWGRRILGLSLHSNKENGLRPFSVTKTNHLKLGNYKEDFFFRFQFFLFL